MLENPGSTAVQKPCRRKGPRSARNADGKGLCKTHLETIEFEILPVQYASPRRLPESNVVALTMARVWRGYLHMSMSEQGNDEEALGGLPNTIFYTALHEFSYTSTL